MVMKSIVVQYKSSLLFRILSQSLLLFSVYMGIQLWQSIGDIKGHAPIIFDQTIAGNELDLRHFKSRPVVVYFWAEWCPICRFQTSAINDITKDYPVISIATFSENKQAVVKYIKDEKIDFSVVFDDNNEWAKLYNVTAIPTIFIVDGKGNIRFVERGFTSNIGLRLRLWWAVYSKS